MAKNKYLGADYWHGYLAYIGFLFGAIITFMATYPESGQLVMGLISVCLLILFLQFGNEWVQSVDPMIEIKYGSYANFQKNSKRDTKFCLMGLFFGFMTFGLIFKWLVILR